MRCRNLFSVLRKRFGALLADDIGASAVLVAVSISSLVGMAGLGVETGLWYAERRQYQTAADAGALAGAWEMATEATAGNTASLTTDNTGSAWLEAVQNGATDSADNITVAEVDDGSGNPTGAQVTVTQPKSAFLAGLFLPNGVTISTTAVASIKALGQPCIYALGGTGTTITVTGGANITAGCVVTAASTSNGTTTGQSNPASINVQGNSTLDATQIYTAGSLAQNGTTNVPVPATETNVPPNPFASIPDPSTTLPPATPCVAIPTGTGPFTLTADATSGSQFCPPSSGNSITLSGATFTLDGVFYVNNANFTIGPNATVNSGADGTTIIMTGTNKIGQITVSSDATHPVTLAAPTSGTYSGLAFYVDPDAPTPNSNSSNGQGVNDFTGAGTTVTGGIYAPSQTVTFQGNAGADCLVVVANVINLAGTSTLDTSGCKNAGLDLPTIYTVALTQ